MLGESPEGFQVEEEKTGFEGSCITCGPGELAMQESAVALTQFSVVGFSGFSPAGGLEAWHIL